MRKQILYGGGLSNKAPSLPPPITTAPVRCGRRCTRHRRVRALAPNDHFPMPFLVRAQHVRWGSIGHRCRRHRRRHRYRPRRDNEVSPDRAAHRSVCSAPSPDAAGKRRQRRGRRHMVVAQHRRALLVLHMPQQENEKTLSSAPARGKKRGKKGPGERSGVRGRFILGGKDPRGEVRTHRLNFRLTAPLCQRLTEPERCALHWFHGILTRESPQMRCEIRRASGDVEELGSVLSGRELPQTNKKR